MDKKPEKLVPEVRFKGFTDDWEQHKLGEISFKVNTKNKENLTLPVLSNSAEYGIVNQEDYFDKKIANRTDNYYIVKHNDFVYNPRISKKAPYGPIRRNTLDTKGLMSPLYYVFRINDGNYIYLDYYFKSSKWYKFMYQNGDSGARSDRFAIKDKIFQMMPISMPNTKEQNKIGQLIQTLQKLIDLQQRKLEQLKQLKKAMLQQLFVSKNSKQSVLRFKNFDSDWRQHSLEDISAKTYSGLTGKSKDDFGHGKARYITYLNVHNNEVAVSDGVEQIEVDSKQNKVLKGDLLFTISSEVPSEVALNSVWSSEAGTDIYLNSFCFGIRPKSNYVNSFFLTYYLRSPQMRKLIYPLAQGISRFNISKRSILALKINTPVLPEQISICKVLMHIDNLITYQQNKLTQLTTLKRYLLQKLFI
ncbi:restriction endonuclease subunit S [Limosilactobacillus reuteri]|uniref:restriction endonuclease subunit S n=1 Tax=Limosilactobacillus reuteri TaxID=1598 RepID=UPI00398D2413